jgi:hypothetical protein
VYAPGAAISVGGAGMLLPDGSEWNVHGTLVIDGTPAVALGHPAWHGRVLFTGTNAKLDVEESATSTWETGTSLSFGGDATFEDGSSCTVLSTLILDGTVGSGFLNIVNGGEIQAFSGSTLKWLAGSSSIFAGTALFQNTSTTGFDSGATCTFANGADLHNGNDNDPTLDSPRSRNIAQPFVASARPNTFGGAVTQDKAIDAASGFLWVPLTKVMNGELLNAVSVFLQYTAHGAPSSPATLTLWRTDVTTGTTSAVATRTLPTTSGSSGTFIMGTSETINDSLYTYALEYAAESGVGSGSITWYPPRLNFLGISKLRSI